jgi:hypothetical protein
MFVSYISNWDVLLSPSLLLIRTMPRKISYGVDYDEDYDDYEDYDYDYDHDHDFDVEDNGQ